MPKYNPKYLNKEEETLIESYNVVDIKKLKKPTLKDQKIFKDAAKDYIHKEIKMKLVSKR